ncbi:MAG: choice-of-anchor D domain-containing protein [Proteobacteria bacterium]|nr:choice-of-anchor D domain-containing protein [Pseudomonadota bacterium]MCP4915403.1 choice-of-anchor D domain-containing protein [Pseudomonadota bacterium]
MSVLPLLFVLGMGADCSDQKIIKIDTGADEDASPLIVVDPPGWDFGAFSAGEGDTTTFKISNEGTLLLDLNDVKLEGDAGFVLDLTGLDSELSPGESTEVTVTFTAQSLDHEGRLVIDSSDPATARAVVDMTGQGLIPSLYVWPSPYDFGRAEPGCTRNGEVYLQNIGRETLEIYSLAQIGEAFVPNLDEITFPVHLEPDEILTVPLDWTPEALETYEGELWIDSNAQDPVVTETGEGAEGSDYVDEFEQPISGKVDIMFYVDQSCSMDDDKAEMSAKFSQFIDELEEIDADYLIMAVTADNGCHNIDYIWPDSSDKDGIFQQAVNGSGGLFTESGLTIAKHATAADRIAGCNSEFLRENSTVSLVLISDEPDQSPAENGYATVVPEILGQAPSTYISAVAGPLPQGCEDGGQSADAGHGYYEAVAATGGLFLSICDSDWGTKLTSIAEAALRVKLADVFYLSDDDVEANSIVVTVDGEIQEEGWELEDGDPTIENPDAPDTPALIRFDQDHIPGEGAHITIEYSSSVDCDI